MKKTIGILLASAIAVIALAVPTLGAGAAQTVRVNEVDGRISLSARPKSGVVKFVVRNAGDEGHDFWLRGGGKRWKTRVLGVGSSATLTARLKKGSGTRTGAASAITLRTACAGASSLASG
jgi:hypothetical protein